MACLVGIPLGLLVLNLALPAVALLPLLAAVGVGAATAFYVWRTEGLRTHTSLELFGLVRTNHKVLGAGVGTLLVAQLVALILGVPVVLWRNSLDNALTAADPCAFEKFDDLSRATDEQKSRLEQRKRACADKRAAERAAENERRCKTIASQFASGTLSSDDQAFLGEFGSIARRAIDGRLTVEDLASQRPSTMPCGTTDSSVAFWRAYVTYAGKSKHAWEAVSSPASVTSDLQTGLVGTLPEVTRKEFQERVEKVATSAAESGRKTDDLLPAKGLCDLEAALSLQASPTCAYALGRYNSLKKQEDAAAEARRKREEAIAAAKDAQEAAKMRALQARCDAVQRQRENCYAACDRSSGSDELGFGNFDVMMSCGARCEKIRAVDCD